jgi:hypothetical protein
MRQQSGNGWGVGRVLLLPSTYPVGAVAIEPQHLRSADLLYKVVERDARREAGTRRILGEEATSIRERRLSFAAHYRRLVKITELSPRRRTTATQLEKHGEVEGLVPTGHEPFGLLATRPWSPETGLTLRSSWNHRRQAQASSFMPAVPPTCHKQR